MQVAETLNLHTYRKDSMDNKTIEIIILIIELVTMVIDLLTKFQK